MCVFLPRQVSQQLSAGRTRRDGSLLCIIDRENLRGASRPRRLHLFLNFFFLVGVYRIQVEIFPLTMTVVVTVVSEGGWGLCW